MKKTTNTRPTPFGERVTNCRKTMNLSQAQLAEKLGVSDSCVWNWENGVSVPPDSRIIKIAEEFRVFPNWLKTGDGPKNKSEEEKFKAEALKKKHAKEAAAIKAKAVEPPKAETPQEPRTYVLSREEKLLKTINDAIIQVGKGTNPDRVEVHKKLAAARTSVEGRLFFGNSAAPTEVTTEAVAELNGLIGDLASLDIRRPDKEDLYLFLNEQRFDIETKLLFK